MKLFAAVLLIAIALSGCAEIKLTEDGLALDKNTSANIEDLGVGSVTRKF